MYVDCRCKRTICAISKVNPFLTLFYGLLISKATNIVEEADANMEVDELELQTILQTMWSQLSRFCGSETLFALRRTCQAFHNLIGSSFVQLERLPTFPTIEIGMDEVLKGYKAIESFRASPEQFTSVSASDWRSWCIRASETPEHVLSHINVSALHLSTAHPLSNVEIQSFRSLTHLSADFLMVFAGVQADAFPGITSLSILPFKENAFEPHLRKLRNDLKVSSEADAEDEGALQTVDEISLRTHFCHLLLNGFSSVTAFSMTCREWEEVQACLTTFIDREKVSLFSKLTKLVLHRHEAPFGAASSTIYANGSSNAASNDPKGFVLPDDISLIPSLLKSLPHLEDLWIDHSISTWVNIDTLDLNKLKRLHATIAGDPPVCLTLSGPHLEYFRLQVHDGSVVTVDPATTRQLQKIEISASLQAISFLLNSLEGDTDAFPHLHTIEFAASMSETTTMPVFELIDLPSLTRLHARFSLAPASTLSPPGPAQPPLPVAVNRQPSILAPLNSNPSLAQLHQHHVHEANSVPLALSLTINGSQLRHLALDLRPGIIVQRLLLSPSLTSLSSLLVASHPSPRASSVLIVEVPYLPPSISTLHIPAQWVIVTPPIAVELPAGVVLAPQGLQSPAAANTSQTMDTTSLSESGSLAYVTMPVKYTSVLGKLSLASFGVPEPISTLLDFHPNLSVLSLQLHYHDALFLPAFSRVLPMLVSLRECLLRLTAIDAPPTLQTPLPCFHFESKSLQMLNLKLLPMVYTKPTPQGTVGSTHRIAAHCASAVDPHLVLPIPNSSYCDTLGRAECNAAKCGCSGYTRDAKNAIQICATIRCGHPASSHRLTGDSNAKWLTLRMKCPSLTHLALAGLSDQNDFSALLRGSPLLTHVQLSFAATPEHMTISHPNVRALHIARLENAKSVYLNLPQLIRLYVESCPLVSSVMPYPTPKLETVSLIASPSVSPDSRLALQRCNVQGQVSLTQTAPPSKYWFPDFVPSL